MDARSFLTNKDAMSVSSMFLNAALIDPGIISANREKLDASYKLSTCRELSYEAWGVVFGAIVRGSDGLEKFRLLPPVISTSPLCVSCLLDNDSLFELALSGKIGYYGIVRLAFQKGIWAK